jgi:hypothetical protein
LLPTIRQGVVGINADLFMSGDFHKLVFHVLGGTDVDDFYVVAPLDERKVGGLIAVTVIADTNTRKICFGEQMVTFKRGLCSIGGRTE